MICQASMKSRAADLHISHDNTKVRILIISNIVDSITRTAETAVDGVNEALFEPVIRLGVTGLSRAGKTVFITSLVANLLDRGRMPQLRAGGRIVGAFLQPQPDDTIARFEYENHLSDILGASPKWPRSTRSISQLRISFRVQPTGILSGLRGPRMVHLDIVDYPGEWLLDLPLMHQTYAQWSEDMLAQARTARASMSASWLAQMQDIDPTSPHDEPTAQSLALAFTKYLSTAREAGYSSCSPGRFLLPGDLQGSPVLTFAPLDPMNASRKSLYREFERRFEAYKAKVVTPFFKDHFLRLDRQIVLVDVLGALHAGPQAVTDLRRAMSDILSCYRVGKNAFLSGLFGKKVDKILFAATKADHLHQNQHGALTGLMQALVRDAKDRADILGVETSAMSLAGLRTTIETTLKHEGQSLDCVQGTLLETGKSAAMYPGELPTDPSQILRMGEQGAPAWLDDDFSIMRFAPAKITLKSGDGPPHIRLDKATDFLIGDLLS